MCIQRGIFTFYFTINEERKRRSLIKVHKTIIELWSALGNFNRMQKVQLEWDYNCGSIDSRVGGGVDGGSLTVIFTTTKMQQSG